MNRFDVGAMTELVLCKLKSEGVWSTQKLYSLKSIGFRPLLKHFENKGSHSVDDEMVKDYLEKQHDIYKGDRRQAWRWKLIRRSAELLMYFAATGQVDMPPLPRWTKRDCQLYVKPNEEKLADSDNIYGLVWRTRHALKEIGYAESTLRYYDLSGFAKILSTHEEAGTEVYSRKLCAKLVLDTQELVEEDKLQRCQAVRKAAALLDEFHRYGAIIPAMLSPFYLVPLNPAFEALVEEYASDALLSGKLCVVTSGTAKSILKGFLLDLECIGHLSFDGVTLATVGDVIIKTASSRYKRGASALLHYVRDFLKYLYEYEHIETDLSVAVPKIAAPFRKVYQGFSDGEIRKLLAAVDRNTLMGKRDYAIMTLAAQTGLRAVDVVNLKRSDIDWRKREIHISQSKTGKPLCLTLEAESGNAIYDYLINARQNCDISNVFLRVQYPLEALNPIATQSIVKKYMDIAGIVPDKHQRYGFHSFRRSFGTRLLESGTPIHMLSQLLGHFDLNSSRPYTSASEQGLKECSLPLTLDESGGGAI